MDSLKERGTYMRRQSGLLAIHSTNIYIILKGNFWYAACDESKCGSVSSTPQRHAVPLRNSAVSQMIHNILASSAYLQLLTHTAKKNNVLRLRTSEMCHRVSCWRSEVLKLTKLSKLLRSYRVEGSELWVWRTGGGTCRSPQTLIESDSTTCCIYRLSQENVPDFWRVFLMLKYTDITQNTYVQSWTVTEIMAREVWNFDSCYTLID